jgi:hypothetical protein
LTLRLHSSVFNNYLHINLKMSTTPPIANYCLFGNDNLSWTSQNLSGSVYGIVGIERKVTRTVGLDKVVHLGSTIVLNGHSIQSLLDISI